MLIEKGLKYSQFSLTLKSFVIVKHDLMGEAKKLFEDLGVKLFRQVGLLVGV